MCITLRCLGFALGPSAVSALWELPFSVSSVEVRPQVSSDKELVLHMKTTWHSKFLYDMAVLEKAGFSWLKT